MGNIEIFEHPGALLLGVTGQLRQKGEIMDKSAIPKLWQALRDGLPQIKNRIGLERYALISGDLPGQETKATYAATVAVSEYLNIPPGFTKVVLPKGRVAKVKHTGPIHTLSNTTKYVFFDWFPKSGESIRENLELFVYPADYNMADPACSFDYYIFIK